MKVSSHTPSSISPPPISPKNRMSPVRRSFADPYGEINDVLRKPRENPSLGKKIRQSKPLLIQFNRATEGGTANVHFSLVWIKQRKVYSHPPSPICPFPISPSSVYSLHLETLRLVSLISSIAKTERIGERSDTNCDTHTHTHTQTDKVPQINI